MILYGSTAQQGNETYSSYKSYLMDVYRGDFQRYSADERAFRVCEISGFENFVTNGLNLFYEGMDDGMYKFISSEMGDSRYFYAQMKDNQISDVYIDEEQKKEENLKFLIFLEEGKWNVIDSMEIENGVNDIDMQDVIDSIFADSNTNLRILDAEEEIEEAMEQEQ